MSCRLDLKVTPRASRNRVVREGDLIRVWVTAAPADGEANAAVVKVLAKALALPPSAVTIVSGLTSRHKTVEVDRLDLPEALSRLG